MPITKSAHKKNRADSRKQVVNRRAKTQAVKMLKNARKNPSLDTLKNAFSAVDRAVKSKVFKGRKADRLKSRLAKLLSTKKG